LAAYIPGMIADVRFGELAEELEQRFALGTGEPWSESDFDALALAAFACQCECMPTFRAFCVARGITPGTVERWQDVPAVPARAFKALDFAVAEPEVVFLTSGTSRGPERRGRHLVPRLSLYRQSLRAAFEPHVLAGSRMPFVSLIPPPGALPSSSLSFMVGTAAAALASEAHWVVDGAGELDEERLRAITLDAASVSEPVLLLGTALALLHLVERLEASPVDPLPTGSRIMATGGFKGLHREIGRAQLYDRMTAATGVPRKLIINEYGMTELLSQLYEPVLSEGPGAAGIHVAPPWLKVRALDPVTLDEVKEGEPGLLTFFDLANAGSVCHVLTEDVGAVVDGRVRLQGRVQGAEPRGCSRAMDELMSSAGTVR
jgi:hypothetical protein